MAISISEIRSRQDSNNKKKTTITSLRENIENAKIEQERKNQEKLQENNTIPTENTSKFFKKPQNFNDGYQKGDVVKTVGATIGDVGLSVLGGIAGIGEGIVDLGRYGIAQVSDWVGADEYAADVRERAKEDTIKSIIDPAKNKLDKYSVTGNMVDDISETVGNVVGMAYGGALLPKSIRSVKAGKFSLPSTSIISGMSSGMTEAYNNDATDGQAWGYGTLSGLTESFSESLFNGLGKTFGKTFGGGALDDVIIKKTTDKIANQTIKTLAQSGLKATGEGLEEVLSGVGNAFAKKLTYMNDEEVGQILKDENLLKQFVMGTLVSSVMQVPSTLTSVKNKTNYIELENIQNNPSNLNQDARKENKPINSLVDTNIAQSGFKIEKNDMLNNIINSRIETKNNIYNNDLYRYIPTKDTKINKLKSSAVKMGLTNSEDTKNLIGTIEKVIKDKNYNVLFDNTITNSKGNSVEAQIKKLDNGEIEIRINPNSQRAGELLLTHEITHAIETDSMKQLVMNYASKHVDFNEALESLKQTYGTNDVSDEVLADISGQLFGNQEFISSLSIEQPNVFRKIYNKIIELANKITGNSREGLFIKDLKNKWEAAYRNTTTEQAVSNLNGGNKFAQKTLKDGTNYIETEKNLFVKHDGTPMSQREIYNSLIGKKITFDDGITATIVNRLPSKDMYNELFKRYPNYKNVKDIKTVNNNINENIVELLENSNNISPNEPDYMNRHQKQGVSSFDTRLVSFFDGKKAYDLTFSIAKLSDGQYVAYAKRNLVSNKELLNKIKKEMPTSKSRLTSLSTNNIPQSNNNVNSGTSSTKHSMQLNQNNTSNSKTNNKWREYLEKHYKATGTRTNMRTLTLPIAKKQDIKSGTVPRKKIPQDPTKESTYNPELVEKRKRIKEKIRKNIQNESYKAINIATKTGQEYLKFDFNQKKQFKNELRKYVGKTSEQMTNVKTWNEIKSIVNKYANKELIYVNQELKDIKNKIRNCSFKITPELKKQISNYSDFRKANFGKLKLLSDGVNIDSVYQELSEQYPYYFGNSTAEVDMLYELSDFMNQDVNIVEKYKLDNKTIEQATKKIYNTLIHNTMNNENINQLQIELEQKMNKRTRAMIQEELLNEMGINLSDISTGNDISSIDLVRTDPTRVNEKVFGAKIGQKINDATINRTKHNESERIRWLNKERKEIKSLGIKPGSAESAAVQKYGEKQYVTMANEVLKYGDDDLAKEFPDIETQNKIKNAANVIRNKYDTYIDEINKNLVEMGYNPIHKRKDYMRHFEALNDLFSKFGTPLNAENLQSDSLPTDINGLTDQFKPGKNFFTSAMERIGLKTEYDAIRGIDGYLEGASNLMFHTEDIQRYRTLSKFIRDTYGTKHGFDDYSVMTDVEQEKRLEDIKSNKLSKYVAWLDEQANSLAGKKGKIDRGTEELLGRKIYNVLDAAKKQVGSNMVGFNVRSALTNFASTVQGASKTNKLSFIKGTISTINNIIHNDGLIDKSDFLTSRFGSKSLSQKTWQKVSNAGQILMEGSDYFTANQIWRSKYYENLSKGMSESQAIKKADEFSARIMGDRSKGSTAAIFNSKTLGVITQFQLEMNNQWLSLIHDNKMDIQNGDKTTAGVLFQIGQLSAMCYMFNNFMKSLTGSAVMLDPIDLLKKIFNPDDEEKSLEERATEVLGEVVNNLPFTSMFTGGRIPIGEAFDGGTTLLKKITNQTDDYGNKYKWKDVGTDVIDSAFYWLLPTGYGQIKKSAKGISMYNKKLPTPGSYTNSGNLRFTADKSPKGVVKAAIFGQYSSKEAQEYIDSGFKTINKNQIEEMNDLGMNSTEYRDYRNGLSKAGKKDAEKLDYINGLDVSLEQKNIMANNVVNSPKFTIDMSEYDNYGSYEELKYSKENPEKYLIISSVTSYDKCLKYQEKISNIKKLYSNTDKRKEEIVKYINTLPYSKVEKLLIYRTLGNYSISEHKNEVFNYINKQNLTKKEKEAMWNYLYKESD